MNIAGYIDHTLLKQTATEDDIRKLCREAIANSFASVCINPCRIPLAADLLSDSSVKVCSVTGFPLGATSTAVKLAETEWCLDNGADEIDTVMNIGEAKSGNWEYIENELREVSELVHSRGAILKVIFENCLLEKDEIVKACEACVNAGVDFVKTSTGFAGGGATPEDVKLMSDTVAGKCKVKAAGGVRNADDAKRMIDFGAERIGTSAGIIIVSEDTSDGGY